MRYLFALVFWAAMPIASAATPDFEALGRTLSEQFLEGETDPVWSQMNEAMRESLGSPAALQTTRQQIQDQFGAPGPVENETLKESKGFQVFEQLRRFEVNDQDIIIRWVFDDEGLVAGFFFKPQPSAAFENYQTKTSLALPFEGEWFVFWGGREKKQNYHVDYSNQRYAYDLIVMRGGSTYKGDPQVAENYYCWGLNILAPAGGEVVVAIDGLPDQVPGEMDAANPPGNHVVIDHGNEEFSLLAHLQNDSVIVAVGDEVEPGQVIGLCGNSGNTSEPHLHYHLQNGDRFGSGHGLPAPFIDYMADRKPVESGEPVRGQFISPATGQ